MDATGAVVLGSAEHGRSWEDDLGVRLVRETEEWLESKPSAATRRGYARDLGLRLPVEHPEKGPPRSPLLGGCSWLDWLRANSLHPLEANEIDVIRWLNALGDAGLAAATRARALASVRSWYVRLEAARLVERSPAGTVSAAKQGIHPPMTSPTIVLSSEHSAAMILAADEIPGPMRLRHSAVVALLLTTGVRVGELCAWCTSDVIDRQGQRLIQVRGKGGRHRRVALADIAGDRLVLYLDSRPDLKIVAVRGQRGGRARVPLLMTRTGNPISTFEVFRLLRRVAVLAGLPEEIVAKLSPHVTRHTTAELARVSGADIEEIRLLLGHASITTTQRYLHASGELLPHGVAGQLGEHLVRA